MAYQTGTFVNEEGLLEILRVFALANGWTQNASTTSELYLQKGSLYFNFNAVSDQLRVSGSIGYAGGSTWDDQPGSKGTGKYGYQETATAGGNYHIFSNTDNIILFAQSGVQWTQLSFGATSLSIPFWACSRGAGGSSFEDVYDLFMYSAYFNSVAPETRASIYLDGSWTDYTETNGSLALPSGQEEVVSKQTPSYRDFATTLLTASTSQFKGNPVLVPTYMLKVYGDSTASSVGDSRYVGHIEGLRILIADNYNEGDTIFFGVDEYIVTKVSPVAPFDWDFVSSIGVAAKK